MTYPAIYILFIGGAADKEPFLWGNINLPFPELWTHKLVGQLCDQFRDNLTEQLINKQKVCSSLEQYCKIDYLSYSEVFFDEIKSFDPNQKTLSSFENDKLTHITQNIGEQTQVYIIGHSLGGWNGAHLSNILSKLGAQVEYLITLDPVGTGNHEISLFSPLVKKAQIYTHQPIPIAKCWFNIQARHLDVSQKQTTGKMDDWVAWAGGQWLIDEHYTTVTKQINEVTNFSHKDVQDMFNYPTKTGYSAYESIIDSMTKTIKHIKHQRYNPVYWLKKLI